MVAVVHADAVLHEGFERRERQVASVRVPFELELEARSLADERRVHLLAHVLPLLLRVQINRLKLTLEVLNLLVGPVFFFYGLHCHGRALRCDD